MSLCTALSNLVFITGEVSIFSILLLLRRDKNVSQQSWVSVHPPADLLMNEYGTMVELYRQGKLKD